VKATEVLIASTESIVYMTVLVSVISVNFVPMISFVGYLQAYSSFYYLNSSAVMQTDVVLASYTKINPVTYYRTFSNPYNFAPTQRLLLTTQTDESLYFRGRPWQYLSDWAFPAFAINVVIWGIAVAGGCFVSTCGCCKRRGRGRVVNEWDANDKGKNYQYSSPKDNN
jgi:hypothetical protein